MTTQPFAGSPVRYFPLSAVLAALFFLILGGARGAEPEGSQEIADRYEQMLLGSPEPGTAFEKVVEWYSSTSGLASLQQRWNKNADPSQRRSLLILQGLLAQRQGHAVEARRFFQEALTLEGEKAQAAKPLAALEATEGNFPAAAAAYTAALSSESLSPPQRLDLLRSLALLYQRAFDTDKALAVWRDAIAKYPDDAFVLEETGEAFLAAGSYEDARKSFTRLRDLATDPFQKIAASLRIARALELEGKTVEAQAIYESALEETASGSWINREVRGQVEGLFRRKDDLPGLLAFYEKRMKAAPQDYSTLVTQSRVLEELGRTEEAIASARNAANLAPGETSLRLGLVRLLAANDRPEEALTEIAELAKPPSASAEILLLTGNLHWAIHAKKPDNTSRTAALAAWNRLAPADSKDIARIGQLAEILGSNGLGEEAAAQWQRLSVLAPELPEPRQRLAEIFLKKSDPKAATEILAGLVEGPRSTPANFVTLARIQERLELADLARQTTGDGLALFPDNFDLLSLAWRQAVDAKDIGAAARLYPALWRQAPGDFAASEAEKKYADFLESAGTGRDAAKPLLAALKDGSIEPPQTALLFRLALQQSEESSARLALDKIRSGANAVRSARAGLDFAQAFGSADDQIAAQQAIAAADPRLAAESLRAAARLLADSGRVEAALEILTQLLEKSPADVSLYTLYSDLAARAGKFDDAARQLNRGIRQVDESTTLRLQLATLLDLQGRSDDAFKVLQEAFEQEESEARRMEIFRRQAEAAQRAGKLDDLIASLREKQLRERNGARYGTYLAEIYLAQDDYLAARDELTRSLGRSPDNPAAITRLIDLAERGGDRDESLRLTKRLSEVAPSAANRAALLSRLFDAGEKSAGLEELARVRSEIIKDPKTWNTALLSLRGAGLVDESDALIDEMVATAGSDVLAQAEMARFRLQQQDVEAAEKILWAMLETGNLAEATQAVSEDLPAQYAAYYRDWRFPFQLLSSEIQNTMQQLSSPSRGYYPSQNYARSSGKATAEQRELVSSVFLLAMLADARNEDDAFVTRLRKLLADRNVPRLTRLMLVQLVNDREGVAGLAKEQAEDSTPDLAIDRHIATFAPDPFWDASVKTIRERLAKADPAAHFDQAAEKATQELATKGAQGEILPEEYRRIAETLSKHPGIASSPGARSRVAIWAAQGGDFPLAFRLCDEEAAAKPDPKSLQVSRSPFHQSARSAVVSRAIVANDPRAAEELEKIVQSAAAAAAPTHLYFSSYGMRLGRPNSPLAQATSDLVAGSTAFPVPLFRSLSNFPPGSPESIKLQKWFSSHASANELTIATLGAIYADWFSGNREGARKRLEAVHAKNPTPDSAALLVEVYEKLGPPAKAIALLETAPLQPDETPDVRSLRTIRLLRAAEQKEEARALAERMARGRVSPFLREQLANELNLLKVPQESYKNLTSNFLPRMSQQKDRSEPVRLQVSKLVADKQTDEAERIAVQFLERPLPSRQDYRGLSARQNMIGQLKAMGRIDSYKQRLEEQLEKHPADLECAVRLAEARVDDSVPAAAQLCEFIQAHPQRHAAMSYALGLLMRSGDGRQQAARALCAMLDADPDLFSTGGLQIHELQNLLSNPNATPVFAERFASMSDETFNRVFRSARLTQNSTEFAIINQLAEVSAANGNIDQAIALLTRLRPTAEKNLDAGLPSILKLAELQLEKGDQAAATATLNALITLRAPRRVGYGVATNSLQNHFTSLLFNPQNWKSSSGLFLRTADLAEKTGTYDALLASFDQQKTGQTAVPTSLVLRTALEKPGIEKEWRKIVLGQGPAGPIPPSLLPLAIKVLSKEKDASKLLPALLAKASNAVSSHYALFTVAEAVPLLGKFKSDPAIAKFISSLVNLSMSDPNGSNYLLFSETYPASMLALLNEGFKDEARALFDFTAATRASGRYGRRPEMEEVERRFQNTVDLITAITVPVTAQPSATGRKTIHWRILPAPKPAADNRRAEPSVAWTDPVPDLPKNLRPANLEIFAGPNPAALERVGKKANPALSGSLEATVPGPIGLMQARWTLPDGSTGFGPLAIYLTGENLLKDSGIPEAKAGRAPTAFQRNQPGPGGEKSAVQYDTVSATSQADVPLATLSLEDKSLSYAFTGWFGTAKDQSAGPTLEIQFILEDSRVQDRGSGYMPLASGQWHQAFGHWSGSSSNAGGETLPAAAKQLKLGVQFQANRSSNGQYPISGLWDNLQLIQVKEDDKSPQISPLNQQFRDALAKKDYAAAANAFLAILRLNPPSVLQHPPDVVIDIFKKSNRLPELFAQAGAPALFLPNPLRNKQPTLNNPGLIAALTTEALDPGAPASTKAWLASLANAPLPEETRFVVEAGILAQAVKRNPDKVSAEKILGVLGFDPKTPNAERLRMLWYFRTPGKPTLALLALFADETLAADALQQLSSVEIPPNMQASRLMLQSWLTAQTDPAKALILANQASEQRSSGQSAVFFDDMSNHILLLRIAHHHPEPGALVATLRSWLARTRPDGREHDRTLVEFLHDAAGSESSKREEYAKLWADAELAALKNPAYKASRDRVRKLAFRLMELADWERLDNLLTTSLASKSLSDDTLKREFTLLRNIANFSRGQTDVAWPVVWCKPGTGSRDVTVGWQWNIRDISHERSDFDTAISIAAKPLLPEISGQTAMEIFFGEMPSEMTLIAKAEGAAAQGALPVTLPASNGFLRAVAILGGKRHPGPLTPVLSGRRVFPPDDTSLRDLLLSGSEPLASASLTASGEAPDGSLALRIGAPAERRQFNYHGPDFPVTPGKFYAERGWMRRTGNGSGTVSSKFTPVKTSKKDTLDMLLSEEMEATDQWVLYTRAVPTVNQHTFWIPMDEIVTMSPRFWDVTAGTELAGFELLEIDDWKYGQWIVELSMLRKNAGDPPDAATLDRAVALASLEPLTAMDYHGDWLARSLTAAGRSDQLRQLSRTALSAEANPLFSRPKVPRIFDYLLGVLHRGEGPPEFRRDLADLILESPARTSPAQRTAALTYAIALAAPENRPAAAQTARDEMARKMADPESARACLNALITARSGRGDRPANELLQFLATLDDAETSARFLKEIQGKAGEGFPLNDRIFATIALQAAQSNAAANPAWTDEVSRAFKATEKLDSPDSYLRWPFVLADFLGARQLAPDVVTALRQESLRRALAAKPEHNGRTNESIRAAAFLIEHTLAQKGDAHETVEAIAPIVRDGSQKMSEGSLRLLLNAAKLLTEAGASADAAILAKAAEPALSRFPKMSAGFSPFLPKS